MSDELQKSDKLRTLVAALTDGERIIIEKKNALGEWESHYMTTEGLADRITSLEADVERKRDALRKAERGLAAGLAQYASKTIHGSGVAMDEQYPWVRLMQIGRDAARTARKKRK